MMNRNLIHKGQHSPLSGRNRFIQRENRGVGVCVTLPQTLTPTLPPTYAQLSITEQETLSVIFKARYIRPNFPFFATIRWKNCALGRQQKFPALWIKTNSHDIFTTRSIFVKYLTIAVYWCYQGECWGECLGEWWTNTHPSEKPLCKGFPDGWGECW